MFYRNVYSIWSIARIGSNYPLRDQGRSCSLRCTQLLLGTIFTLKTTHDNIDEHRVGNFGTFPKTLRDAISITNQLNIRYLWIDALCIIQGDKQDWAEQAVAMTGIYQGSTLTISALSSRDCNYGMLNVVSDPVFRIGTYCHPDDRGGQGDIFVGVPKHILDLGEKHLSSRGWAFQERLVSIASLHYTDEGMVWECASRIALEHDQGYRRFKWKSDWKSLMRRQSMSPKSRSLRVLESLGQRVLET